MPQLDTASVLVGLLTPLAATLLVVLVLVLPLYLGMWVARLSHQYTFRYKPQEDGKTAQYAAFLASSRGIYTLSLGGKVALVFTRGPALRDANKKAEIQDAIGAILDETKESSGD